MIQETTRDKGWLKTLAACMGTEADRRNQMWVAGGTIAWALAYVVTNELMAQGGSLWLIAIPAAVSIWVVWAYARFLRETDEYVRLLQYQGLALGFALSLFVVALLEALAKAGHPFDAAHESATIMLVSWAAGQLFVAWRHR